MKNQSPLDILRNAAFPISGVSLLKWGGFLVLLLFPVLSWAQDAATQAMSVEYRDIPGIGSQKCHLGCCSATSPVGRICAGSAHICMDLRNSWVEDE